MKQIRPFTLLLTILIVLFFMPAVVYAQQTVTITFTSFSYSPNAVTINQGDSVKWSGTFTFHPLQQVVGPSSDTPTTGGFSYSGSNTEFTVTFNNPGTYYYLCTNHGTNGGTMRGSITVVDPSQPTPTPTVPPTLDPNVTPSPTPSPTPCASKPVAPVLIDPPSGHKTTSQTLTLAWSSSTCATSYKVELRRDKKTNPVIKKKTTPDTIFVTGKLARLHTYFWSVKACNEIGCTPSKTAKFTISKARK